MIRRWVRGSGILPRSLRSSEGSQILEFALAAPFLIVVVIGIIDFASVYSLKQKLNNAAREGARYGASQELANLDSTQASAIGNVVSNYMTNAGLTQCAVGSASGGPTDYTFGASGKGCGSFKLEVNRAVPVTLNGTAYLATKVTITYPVNWSIGTVMKLFLPSSTLKSALPSTVATDATIENIN
ncbi:MAG TPA: TadE/TadG family type IV pilus assembly protein [Candidatus Acidoferrales bacterium]|nr:TadE/TadG family type IV pilus assembly protein [Candidatus Acidoferrales bacterium]